MLARAEIYCNGASRHGSVLLWRAEVRPISARLLQLHVPSVHGYVRAVTPPMSPLVMLSALGDAYRFFQGGVGLVAKFVVGEVVRRRVSALMREAAVAPDSSRSVKEISVAWAVYVPAFWGLR